MKRSRAFILSEQLMTIMLQASFILVLCASFYQLISFYTRTQQVLTARNHAERVISFMDDKIRNAGLGLWKCRSSAAIREKFTIIGMLSKPGTGEANSGYKWPVALKWNDGLNNNDTSDIPSLSISQNSGDVLTVLYAKRNPTSDASEAITAFKEAKILTNSNTYTLQLLDKGTLTNNNPAKVQSLFDTPSSSSNINNYAVMESLGVPMWIEYVCTSNESSKNKGDVDVRVYNLGSSETITVPAAGDLMTINCMQMFVHDKADGQGRQFAFRELTDGGNWESKKYNQEKGILDIYMEVDRMHNIFTLWVLATGGYDASLNNPRPDTWPKEANPRGNTDQAAKTAWLANDYCHHIVYVSRASWKLNNIPQGFIWD